MKILCNKENGFRKQILLASKYLYKPKKKQNIALVAKKKELKDNFNLILVRTQ